MDTVLPPPATGVTVTTSPVTRVTRCAWAVDADRAGTEIGAPVETLGDDRGAAPAEAAGTVVVARTAADPTRSESTRRVWVRWDRRGMGVLALAWRVDRNLSGTVTGINGGITS